MKAQYPDMKWRLIQVKEWIHPFVWIVLVVLCSGCVTRPKAPPAGSTNRQALKSIPEIAPGNPRSDQALVGAFFAANGIRLTPDQITEIIPSSAPLGNLDRDAIQRIAKKQGRRLMVLKADERFLWDELGQNLPLLVLLPPSICYGPSATPLIPVSWDAKKATLELLNGKGEIQSMSAAAFFARREPLKHAALCLVKPKSRLAHGLPREQQLLTADFWYEPSFYRRENVIYTAIQEETFKDSADVGYLTARGNALVRKGHYKAAVPFFTAALDLDPDNPKILNNLAYALFNGHGELLTALRHANKANQLDPGNPLVLETLGTINMGLGDADAAVRYLKQAWARSLKHAPEIQIAIMDQLVRAWLAADRQDLAWQVAEYRNRTYPQYRFAQDILHHFPALRRAQLSARNNLPEGG